MTATPEQERLAAQQAAARRARDAHRGEAIAGLLALYPPEALSVAVLDVAREAGVAVAWESRETFEAQFDVTFTAEEWDRVAGELDNFDECLSNAFAVRDWMGDVLRAADLDVEALQRRTDVDRARKEAGE